MSAKPSIIKKIVCANLLLLLVTSITAAQTDASVVDKINNSFEYAVKFLDDILFWDPVAFLGINAGADIPFIVIWLIVGGIFFSLKMKFINVRGLKHAIDLTRGKYNDPQSKGEVSHFQALATALSATVGLGNIAGVAIAISLGGGNMLQSNQAFSQLIYIVPSLEDFGFWIGVILAILVGLVIIGGIKSIARVTEKIVPFMAVLYTLTALIIIILNISEIGNVIKLIFVGVFKAEAIKGGVIGVLIMGFRRGAFSNEAGIGSASIAHSAARTDEPVSEGLVALLEPFIDTVVICTMTALVIIFTGFHENPQGLEGAPLTAAAFGSVFNWFPYILLVSIFLFAFSTMISWSYYGLKGFNYLFGDSLYKIFKTKLVSNIFYQLLFLFCIVVGTSSMLDNVLDFSDMMILAPAFPNIIGLYILAPEVKKELNIYLNKIKSGVIRRFK